MDFSGDFNKDYKIMEKKLKYLLNDSNINFNKKNHLRITKISQEQSNKIFDLINNSLELNLKEFYNTNYSKMYKTFFVYNNNTEKGIHFVVGIGEFKIKTKNSLVPKQLAPEKLNISGYYDNKNKLINDINYSIEKADIPLNISWGSKNSKEFNGILKKIIKSVIDPNIIFSLREQEIIKDHKASLGKDFGELLGFINLLCKHGNIDIPQSQSNQGFDVSFYKNGIKNLINIKSNKGSGQSFKNVSNPILSNNQKNSEQRALKEFCLKIINILKNKNIKGIEKYFEIAEQSRILGKKENVFIGTIFNKISELFFQGKKIEIDNFNPPHYYLEYYSKLENMLNQLNIKKGYGLPSSERNRQEDYQYFYENSIVNKQKAIAHTIATLFSGYFDLDGSILTSVIKDNVEIEVLNVDFDKNGRVVFDDYSNAINSVYYQFHYWGRFKAPTHNLLGYKTIKN